jgi:transposase
VTHQIFMGVDVAKDWLDIYHASHGGNTDQQFASGSSFLRRPCAKEAAWAVFDASGGYDHQPLPLAG